MTWYRSITRLYISPTTQKTLGVQGSRPHRDIQNLGPSTVQAMSQPNPSISQRLIDNVWKIVHMCLQELSSDASNDEVKAFAWCILEPCRDMLNEVGEGVSLEALLETSLHATRRPDIVTPTTHYDRKRAPRPKSTQNPPTQQKQHPIQESHQPPIQIHREEMNGGSSNVNPGEGPSDAAYQPLKRGRKKNPRTQ